MSTSRNIAVAVGGLFWAGLVGSAVMASRGMRTSTDVLSSATATSGETAGSAVSGQMWNYFSQPATHLELVLPEVPARDGDPIFTQLEDGLWIQTGYLTSTDSRHSATQGKALWYTDLDPAEYRFEYHRNRGKFADVMRMLLPPEKRAQIEQLIREAIEENGKDITEAMRPILAQAMRDSGPVVERALKQSLHKHRDELAALGERYRAEVLEQRLLPLVREEVIPIVRKHAEPVANQIGHELWDRASLWRFGWRALYDRTPLPDRELLREEWDRFVQEEAIPVFESHTEDLVKAQANIFIDVSSSERVRAELRQVAKTISEDRELHRLLTAILRESVVENDELRDVWANTWKSAEAQAALKLATDRLEPVVRQIGDEMFGTRDGGISPTFARVLRNQILGKDRRWIVAVRTPGAANGPNATEQPIRVHVAQNRMMFPLTVLASPDEPTAPLLEK